MTGTRQWRALRRRGPRRPDPAADVIEALARGDQVTVSNSDLIAPGARELFLVMWPCRHAPRGYYCETHGAHLANAGNLETHCELRPGTHRVTAWCPVCGYVEPAGASRDVLKMIAMRYAE
jgi:hypothetical protein